MPTINQPISELGKQVIRALASSKYSYRSLEGLSADLQISAQEVQKGLNELFAKKQIDQLVKEDRIRYFLTPEGRTTAYLLEETSAALLSNWFQNLGKLPSPNQPLFDAKFLDNLRKALEDAKDDKPKTPPT